MKNTFASRSTGCLIWSGALVASASLLQAQALPFVDETASAPLPEMVVSATRSLQDPRFSPSAVNLVPLQELAASQVGDLRVALSRQPGVTVVSTGPTGGQTSVFMRGASSHHTLFVVDGVRMSDRAASYTNFVGGADLAGLDRLEVLRGPQSTLYGSSAMGGVVLMETARGSGAPAGQLAAMAGSFDTWGAGAAVQGGAGTLGFSTAVARFVTDNDAPNNGFESWSYSGRLELQPAERVTMGVTFRRTEGEFEEVGSRAWPSAAVVESDNVLGTVYGQYQRGGAFTSRLTLARHERDYVYIGEWMRSEIGNVRRIAEWQNTWQATEQIEIVAGANHERSRYRIAGDATRDEINAGYVSATARVNPAVTLTGGMRYDRYNAVGDATTGRVGAAWLVLPTLKLRATYGTGFTAPGSDDRFGVPSWGQRPNPDLVPEKSRGWDVGVDYTLLGGGVDLSATYFENRFRNLFEWETVDFATFEGIIVNRARASSDGFELAAVARPVQAVRTRLAYTYLEARNETTRERLVRRPRHSVDAEVRVEPTAAWTFGAGLRAVAKRVEAVDFNPGPDPIEDFTTVRVFASYLPRPDLEFRVRVENALNETYEEVYGYPSLPRGVFGSVHWRF